ncbi:ATP-binding protein [Pyxidicoccus caerfyrddinensis]|uniref:ATP-binding protein n=1 Tax=Pyxidicoccus caerfyrddinensis TaxID=2709663 RepID=UPI0013DB42A3|nr:ATP-binding protein [Pyxidicoccus caerfyrddinensis]
MDEKNSRETPREEAQLRALLAAMEAANRGDFSQRLPLTGVNPLLDRLAEAFNTGVALQAERATRLSAFVADVTRVAREVGVEGRLGGQVELTNLSDGWRELAESVNVLAGSLTLQVRCLAKVSTAVARGDLSEKVTVEVRGESLTLKNTINTMVDQLQAFADEVTRVAKEVGPEGKVAELPAVPGVSGVWKDLTDNVSFTEQLALASRYKSEFLANMSHELRTPLNSLLILAKVLSENKERHLSSKEVEYAKTIHASGSDLLELINDILDLSKVEAGKLRVEPCDVPLLELKSFVERSFTHVAEHKGLGFRVNLTEGLPYGLRTDPQRLQQVLKNLLSNAFKFTDTGRVELHVRQVEDKRRSFDSELLNRADRVLAFSVVDSGIGIPKDKQHLIFEAFQQADGGTSRKYGGTGLGLSISRELARLLGGELHVESEPGKGSTFTLFLPRIYVGPDEAQNEAAPVEARTEPVARPPPSVAPAPELVGRKVLVVDDDIRNIFALTSILEGRGLQVLHAENGREGINVLHAHPDVNAVLMDVMMPELDGYETMRAIREDPRFADLRIIAITARALKDEREKCLAAGASDYLTKPVDTEQLLALLKS